MMIMGGGLEHFIFSGTDEGLMRRTLACFLSVPCEEEEDLVKFQTVCV